MKKRFTKTQKIYGGGWFDWLINSFYGPAADTNPENNPSKPAANPENNPSKPAANPENNPSKPAADHKNENNINMIDNPMNTKGGKSRRRHRRRTRRHYIKRI